MRPRKIFEAGPFDVQTTWLGPIVTSPPPGRVVRVLVRRPAGGGHKATTMFDGRVGAGATRTRPAPQVFVLAPHHRLYITAMPPVPGFAAHLLQRG